MQMTNDVAYQRSRLLCSVGCDAWPFSSSRHTFGVSHHVHILSEDFDKIQVNTAKYDILSSEKQDKCEIRQNAQKQFQAMDRLETCVVDA